MSTQDKEYAAQQTKQHPDDTAVDALAAAMKAKLAKQRAKGYGGWDTDCTQQRLSDLLRGHVDKGDPVDVANFCAFLLARGEGIVALQSAQAAQQAYVLEDDGHETYLDGCESRFSIRRADGQAVAWVVPLEKDSGEAVAREIIAALNAAHPTQQGLDADMFWDADDPERCETSINNVVVEVDSNRGLKVGDTVTIQRAKSLPDLEVRVTQVPDTEGNGDLAWAEIDAAQAKQGGQA